ncbi:MAG: hypothetical protein COA79_10810 [Planctomycetota bacterium]|nr:MAG: hypothetical protein COA79_10810 [Planctomycetota bacterium]
MDLNSFQELDKINHAFAFFVLSFLLDHAFHNKIKILNQVWLLIGFGILIECVQFFLPHREFSIADIFADLLGILWYVLLEPYLKKLVSFKFGIQPKKKHN